MGYQVVLKGGDRRSLGRVVSVVGRCVGAGKERGAVSRHDKAEEGMKELVGATARSRREEP
jgi:hypothetical protein